MAAPPSLLTGPPERLLPWLGLGVAVHFVGVGLVAALALLLPDGPEGPLIDPDDVIQVAMVAPPKAEGLPQRATRQAAPRAPDPAPQPAAEAPEPPPVQSEMAVHDEQPTKQPEAIPDDSSRKIDVNAEMNDLLADLDGAAEGDVDRDAASPDGVDGAPATALSGLPVGDPAYAAYIAEVSALFDREFHPIPALKGQGLLTKVFIRTNEEGRIVERRVLESSGNELWDAAALRATKAVAAVPLPPESLRDRMALGYAILLGETP